MTMVEVILQPGSRPGRFQASVAGEIIVESSRDPEHAAARALVARGVIGEMVTRWQGSPLLATRPRDIEAVARINVVDRPAGGLRIEPHRAMPSSHVRTVTSV